jgi:hypothetical protein
MTETSFIEIFIEEDFFNEDADLVAVRSALQEPNVRLAVNAELRSIGAKALVITNEYDLSRLKDTDRIILLHLWLNGGTLDLSRIIAFQDKIEELLGVPGWAVTFDIDRIPSQRYLISDVGEDPFREIIQRASKRN